MLPTTERQLRKKFQQLSHEYERRIDWFQRTLRQQQELASKRYNKILTLEKTIKRQRIGIVVLVIGFLLHLITKLW